MVREDLKDFIKTIPSNVTIVAATKYVEADDMKELYRKGINNFGENRVDSFLLKYNELSNLQINWHFIGHLQTNKAKEVVNKIDCLHSLDSLKLAKIINDNRETPLDCFIEVSINEEETKNGVKVDDLNDFVKEVLKFPRINLVGFMMMAKRDSRHNELLEQFRALNIIRVKIENEFKIKTPYLSMGMSDDYKEALQCGATHIRLGRILYKQ